MVTTFLPQPVRPAGTLRVAIAAACLFSPSLLGAGAAAPAGPALPQLIRTLSEDSADSPLVLVAKRTVAARIASGARNVIAIGDRDVRSSGGRVSFASPSADSSVAEASAEKPATYDACPTPAQRTAAEKRAETERAAASARVSELKQTAERLAAEELEPYSDDVSEDEVDLGLTMIPEEIDALTPVAPPPQQAP